MSSLLLIQVDVVAESSVQERFERIHFSLDVFLLLDQLVQIFLLLLSDSLVITRRRVLININESLADKELERVTHGFLDSATGINQVLQLILERLDLVFGLMEAHVQSRELVDLELVFARDFRVALRKVLS